MATGCLNCQLPANGIGTHESDLTPTAVRELLEQQAMLLRLTVHELRRPIAIVNGYLSMMREGSLGSPAGTSTDRALAVMAGAVQEMAGLIEGLAAVARHDDQAEVLRRRRCRLRGLVAASVAAVELEARSRRVDIIHDGPEVEANVDPVYLRVVLVNLLSNAVRHATSGVAIAVTPLIEDSAVRISVSDDGPGIPLAEVEHVFEPWYQGPSSNGLGLGLWIVRRIVEWHGGRVVLATESGLGTTFGVVLPVIDERW